MTDLIRALVAAVTLAAAAVAAPAPDQGGVGTAIWSGSASFVKASYGRSYLALPKPTPRGTRVRIVGPGGGVTRTSTDVGPDQSIWPDRVADLSYADFEKVCGPRAHERGLGTCRVSVEQLDSSPGVTPPPTDTE